MCYGHGVDDSVSIRELRNQVSAVIRRVEAGERLTVTVDRRPVAKLVPLEQPREWVPWEVVEAIRRTAGEDPSFLDDIRRLAPGVDDDADVW